MAKITGPLMSSTASGSIAETFTFSQRSTGQQVRIQRKQKDVITADRTAQRIKFSLGLDLWRSLPDAEKAYWKTLSNCLPLYL